MDVALLGGTGDVGQGLALRWGYHTTHDVVVGSRSADRAREAADEYEVELSSRGLDRTVGGEENADAAAGADVVVLAVPPLHVRETLDAVAGHLADGTVVVSPAVGMTRDDDGMHYDPPKAGSLTQLVARAAPATCPVVGAYHSIPAARLANLDADLGMDVPLVADDDDARETVAMLTEAIPGLRAVDAGPLANAPEVESVTPLVINCKRHTEGLRDLGIKFV